MTIIEHTEKFLGKISRGWRDQRSSDGLQIVCFENSPYDEVNTFLTIGLSSHELRISDAKSIRHELILPISGLGISEEIVSLMFFMSEYILNSHQALLRGQVVELPLNVAKKIGFEALYCAIPVFLDDDFATFNEMASPVVIVWLIPIYSSESKYIAANGWNRFEDLLEQESPDLFSLRREHIKLNG
ncbi:suppressor of fused domain protein [Acinetobacter halotolerans]|uniref:Suppressor of fused domain protein n=1 Tax=Acinetobacter halotolerans TaxID=1752076 RepID=A0A4Q6XF49_9GAMM|nr:suppressor of fused domain protein [Acinetobacter halotolerans]RZF56883.1 suppressor of fused domain protein [Acinetobacter halotolerans]